MKSAAWSLEVEPAVALHAFYARLLSKLGSQNWWPARTRIEIIVGAILVQNTAWQNAAIAIKRLRSKGLLRLARLRDASLAEIEACVRPAGSYHQKARTIKNFLNRLEGSCEGSLEKMFNLPAQDLRSGLLAIRGLGPETVDAILLYAGGRPFFVADSNTRRVLTRHQLIRPGVRYDDAQEYLHRHLPRQAQLFNEFHALLVEVGKQYCKRPKPICLVCPLESFLGANLPAEVS